MKFQMTKATVVMVLILTALSGCTAKQNRTRSSVVDYLYPKQSATMVQPSIPVLNIPIAVGIAFVPEQPGRSTGYNVWSGVVEGGALTEAHKADLLEKIADNFFEHEFVSEIEIIPSAYLTAGGGFENLEQLRTMYGIDVIALVSYDQVQFTDERFLSLTYWTLVGAYVFSGEKNDTSTMFDTAVYDIPSKKMLFRAPGTSNVKGRSTPVNLGEELRADSLESFAEATDEMIKNLDIQLSGFRDKIKQNPGPVQVVQREGYSGADAFGLLELAFMFLFVVLAGARKQV